MDNLYNAIFKGLAPVAKTSVQEALDAGKTPQEIIDDSMIPAMEAIGQEFEAGRVFVPNLLLSARARRSSSEPSKVTFTISARTSWLRCWKDAVSR